MYESFVINTFKKANFTVRFQEFCLTAFKEGIKSKSAHDLLAENDELLRQPALINDLKDEIVNLKIREDSLLKFCGPLDRVVVMCRLIKSELKWQKEYTGTIRLWLVNVMQRAPELS